MAGTAGQDPDDFSAEFPQEFCHERAGEVRAVAKGCAAFWGGLCGAWCLQNGIFGSKIKVNHLRIIWDIGEYDE